MQRRLRRSARGAGSPGCGCRRSSRPADEADRRAARQQETEAPIPLRVEEIAGADQHRLLRGEAAVEQRQRRRDDQEEQQKAEVGNNIGAWLREPCECGEGGMRRRFYRSAPGPASRHARQRVAGGGQPGNPVCIRAAATLSICVGDVACWFAGAARGAQVRLAERRRAARLGGLAAVVLVQARLCRRKRVGPRRCDGANDDRRLRRQPGAGHRRRTAARADRRSALQGAEPHASWRGAGAFRQRVARPGRAISSPRTKRRG